MNTDMTKINPGPWTFDKSEHCIIDNDGNVVAEFYENDENGILLTRLFNDNLRELDYPTWLKYLSNNQLEKQA